MPKPNLLLLDADVIVVAHEIGVWENLIQQCSISVTETTIVEAKFWFDQDGGKHSIDLASQIREGRINSISHAKTNIRTTV